MPEGGKQLSPTLPSDWMERNSNCICSVFSFSRGWDDGGGGRGVSNEDRLWDLLKRRREP